MRTFQVFRQVLTHIQCGWRTAYGGRQVPPSLLPTHAQQPVVLVRREWELVPVNMAVTINTSGIVAIGTTSAANISLSAAQGGNNAIALELGTSLGGRNATSITYTSGSGNAFVRLGSTVSGSLVSEIWSSIGPSSTVTIKVGLNVSTAGDISITGYSLSGVDQTTAMDGYTFTTANVTLTVTTNSGSLALAMVQKNPDPSTMIQGIRDQNTVNNQFWSAGHNTNASTATLQWTVSTGTKLVVGGNVRVVSSAFVPYTSIYPPLLAQ
jgi:hypothetical protein